MGVSTLDVPGPRQAPLASEARRRIGNARAIPGVPFAEMVRLAAAVLRGMRRIRLALGLGHDVAEERVAVVLFGPLHEPRYLHLNNYSRRPKRKSTAFGL